MHTYSRYFEKYEQGNLRLAFGLAQQCLAYPCLLYFLIYMEYPTLSFGYKKSYIRKNFNNFYIAIVHRLKYFMIIS